MSHNVVVVGGGVIGLSIAWRLASGHDVTVVDPTPARGASWVAGGMLAPVTEAWPGEEELLDIGAASLAAWPGFAADLGIDLYTEGTVVAGFDAADAAQLDIVADYLARQGRTVDRLTGRELRRVEPTIGPSVRSGLRVPGDLAVDNRELLRRLTSSAAEAGVEFLREPVRAVRSGAVELAGSTLRCDTAVIAAGAWSSGLHPALASAVRPVKGEILRLRARAGTLPPPRHTVRAFVESRPIYLVPRADGELVLGATQYEAGFDTAVTAGGVRDLLVYGERVLPAIAEYELTETAAGLRAGSRDNLPLVGRLEPGVLVAAGHHRNGLLLAPITADAIRAMAAGAEPPAEIKAADPARLER
ncbi:glycine oxidase ThiO [Actinophytocola algeriensis]|uniref:glycine oxidase n=1 Tax=Actinophytocola algeriensis TaxID=1768010 RepID=A0A7W7Q5A7_9PSEU|nr:glycine oxidase ThiO [Actinophytocola algeriensis]MBB4907326.1 glycine oxidase [Actinophytocola algeriensis]MBE1478809.1 glycine oxidase [Actinophytocola algeriensis]